MLLLCSCLGRSVTSEVVVALVIGENENDVGWPLVSDELGDLGNEKSDFENTHIRFLGRSLDGFQ